MGYMLKSGLILAAIVLFLVIFGIIDTSNHIIILKSHPFKLELLLTIIFFALSAILITITYKITVKHEINKAKDKCMSKVNHELRTYVTAISGALKIISNNLVGEIPTAMKDMLNIANKNVIKLLELVDDLTNFKKP